MKNPHRRARRNGNAILLTFIVVVAMMVITKTSALTELNKTTEGFQIIQAKIKSL